MTKIRQKQAKLTVSPYFFQVSARKIGHQNRDRKKERNRTFHTNKNELHPFTYFYREHVFFIQFLVNVMVIHSQLSLMRIWCLKTFSDFSMQDVYNRNNR